MSRTRFLWCGKRGGRFGGVNDLGSLGKEDVRNMDLRVV